MCSVFFSISRILQDVPLFKKIGDDATENEPQKKPWPCSFLPIQKEQSARWPCRYPTRGHPWTETKLRTKRERTKTDERRVAGLDLLECVAASITNVHTTGIVDIVDFVDAYLD